MGGSWTVNGKDQYGETISESILTTVTSGTAANGGTAVGTMIFAQVTSGTFTFTTGAIGSGTPKVKYANAEGTTRFGLPFRLGGTADLKNFVYKPAFVTTAINGGTLGAYVGTGGFNGFNNYVRGTAAIGTADVYVVTARPTYNADSDTRPQTGLSQVV